uniref:C2H2-type domain-containing protein n=1 Tax=Eptatretus burgeri TaxID=7764 RepID=A0A8C4QPG1_EPTBU
MAETEVFTMWLQAQGLRRETVQIMVTELGIESQELLKACTESDSVTAELFSLVKQKFPFAMYAELLSFVRSCRELRVVKPADSALLNILSSMLNNVSQEFSSCAQKLNLLQPPCTSHEIDNGDLETSNVGHGVGIRNFCSFSIKEEDKSTQLEDLVVAGSFQSENPSTSFETFPTDIVKQELYKPYHEDSTNVEPPAAEDLMVAGSFQSENPSTSFKTFPTRIGKQELYKPYNEDSTNVEPPAADMSTDWFSPLQSKRSKVWNKVTLKKHTMTHTQDSPSEMYKCIYCHYSSKLKNKLFQHAKIHMRNNMYECFVCGKTFPRLHKVTDHMMNHTGERPYKCCICGKGFRRLADRKVHMRIHTGERPYNCSICGRSFKQSAQRDCHIMTHTGERPYKCYLCSKCFSRSSTLKIHMKTHTRECPTVADRWDGIPN